MCGIAGAVSLSDAPVASRTLFSMCDSIAHRGPDDAGYLFGNSSEYRFLCDERFLRRNDPCVTIQDAMEDSRFQEAQFSVMAGHRRLSIIDLSPAGRQPMSAAEGALWITFNGEIYNFRELRAELEQLGYSFRTRTDTEVILNGYHAWGRDIVRKLNGMFAFFLWDRRSGSFLLARDRCGVKPLYYSPQGGVLLFASEIKAMLKYPGFRKRINLHALNEYFTFQNIFTDETLFDGVQMLPAGYMLHGSVHGGFTREQYWDYDFSHTDESIDFSTASLRTQELLTQAVKRQMMSDVPVGSYLSGGMDSGSITSLASREVGRLTTFTGGFEMAAVEGRERGFDERIDAELMANAFKTEHYEQVINAGDMPWVMPRLVYHLEDLRVGMSYPNYYISRLASKFVKVCLTGVGGDELYGGYPWRYYRLTGQSDREAYFREYYSFWQRLVPTSEKQQLFKPDTLAAAEQRDPFEVFRNVFLQNKTLRYDTVEAQINSALYFELKTFLHGLLVVGDKLSMANSLEERFPFLDNDLVQFATSIPVRHKLKNLEQMKQINENTERKLLRYYQEHDDGKNVLRMAMQGLLPEKIINRKKQGFSAPDESWYRGANYQYVVDTIVSGETRLDTYIEKEYVRRIVQEHSEKSNHRLLIWSFICFEEWCRQFGM